MKSILINKNEEMKCKFPFLRPCGRYFISELIYPNFISTIFNFSKK